MSDSTRAILQERGERYGAFYDQAEISQALKHVAKNRKTWERMHPFQKEALEMIIHKIARIANGDPHYVDSWQDIAGYAQLVVDTLQGERS